MKYKEFKQYVDKTNKNIADKLKDNEEELAFYTRLVKRFNDICDENEKLKKQLEEKDTLVKQCEISVTNVMDCYCERTDCSSRIKDSKKYDSLQQENEELKKRLEEKEEIACNWKDSCLENAGKIEKIENQQQEFIKYLKSINSFETIGNILTKYKETMGVKDE